MDKITTIEKTAELFDFDEMYKDVAKAKWYILDLDTKVRSIKMQKPELVYFIKEAFNKNFDINEIDTQKIFGYRDSVYMILVDQSGDL